NGTTAAERHRHTRMADKDGGAASERAPEQEAAGSGQKLSMGEAAAPPPPKRAKHDGKREAPVTTERKETPSCMRVTVTTSHCFECEAIAEMRTECMDGSCGGRCDCDDYRCKCPEGAQCRVHC